MITDERGPGCLIRLLYFIFVGLWLGGILTLAAWLLNVTIIGLPLGLMIINRLPQFMTLKPVPVQTRVMVQDGRMVTRRELAQAPHFLLRAVWFILIGWWASLVWMLLAWLISGVTLGLGLPLAFWMFDQVPWITTLARY
jgi:uncharacterized membrane protein YccF (DUF307 family)